jgi:hemoglobin
VSAASVRCDIATRDDITGLVAEFYRRAFADEVLGPIFFDVARVDLCAHVPVMGDFWDTALLRRALSPQRPPPHVALAAEVELTDAHFARWLALWTATVEGAARGAAGGTG